MIQKNRVYSLIVGDDKDGIEINTLRIRFTVTKTSDNKKRKNQATVDIYNLSEEKRKLLDERYVTVQLKVGYAGESTNDLVSLFTGQVVTLDSTRGARWRSKREGPDIVTNLVVDEFFKELNGRKVSRTVPAGKTVRDVILALLKDLPEITRHEMNGKGIEREVPDGYPLLGAPRRILDALSRTYNIEWQIDQGVLYVSDVGGSFSDDTSGVPVIGVMTGLIGRPEFTTESIPHVKSEDSDSEDSEAEGNNSSGSSSTDSDDEDDKKGEKHKGPRPKRAMLKVKILLDPTLTAGSIIKLDYPELTGYYKIDSVQHKGDYGGQEWYSDLTLQTDPV